LPATFGEGTPWGHFTDAQGVRGVTGIVPERIPVGETVVVQKLTFGQGKNPFMANQPGDIFVTDLTMKLHPSNLGVEAAKQGYLISFSNETAFANGVRVVAGDASRGIFTIPGGTTMRGAFTVTRLR
jgi:hypothetical protein